MNNLNCKTKLFSRHAVQKMFERRITKVDIEHVISSGEIIKNYPDDPLSKFVIVIDCK